MLLDRVSIKSEAKDIVKNASVSAYLFTLLFLALSWLLTGMSDYVSLNEETVYNIYYATGVDLSFLVLHRAFPALLVTFITILAALLGVLLEIGYHDNTADAVWIQDNVQYIAENLSRSLAEYFALPFIYPMTPRTGTVVTERDALNVRAYPAMSGQVVGSVPHEAQLTVYGQTHGWYSMGYGNLAGYVRSEYVRL